MRFSVLLFLLIGSCFSIMEACHPRIYFFSVSPLSAGADDSIRVGWKVKGTARLLLHDAAYPPVDAWSLVPVTMLASRENRVDSVWLGASDTGGLKLTDSGSLVIRNVYHGDFGERLRSLRLVVTKSGKDSTRDAQVAYYPDTASDRIGYRVVLVGDSLVAEGENNSLRWGDLFEIVTVTNGSGRPLRVSHAEISATLLAGGPPSRDFAGSAVKGFWSFGAGLTPEEKKNPALIPPGLIINITIKHR
jgi:hypothetical protein